MMIIRSAVLSDREGIYLTHKASIENLCAEHYSAQDIAGWIEVLSPGIYENAIGDKVMIVSEEGDEIIGLGILDLERNEISAVYIHPGSKGTGVGKRILQELERRAFEGGAIHLTLCSTINAVGFYKKHGYIEDGSDFHELPNGVRLTCIRMHRGLTGC